MDKWTRKYLKLGRTLAEDNSACYSRKIGVVLVSENNRILSLGYNGTVSKVPHPDSSTYLYHAYEDLFTDADRTWLKENKGIENREQFRTAYVGKKICPRRILGVPSGQRLELCPCAHAERNALASANQLGVSTLNSRMYCYCGVPCHECTVQIIQSGVKKVYCLATEQDYSLSSKWLFNAANVLLVEVNPTEIDKPEEE